MNPATPSTTPPALTAPQPRSAGHVHEVAFVAPAQRGLTIEVCICAGPVSRHTLDAEIVIGDNGSMRLRRDLARRARVVNVSLRAAARLYKY